MRACLGGQDAKTLVLMCCYDGEILTGMSSDESKGSEGLGVLRLHIHKLPRIHSGKVRWYSWCPV